MLVTLPILCSCLNSIYSWDPGCLKEQYGMASHGPPRLSIGIGSFPRRFYRESAFFRVHDSGFTAFSREVPYQPLYCDRMTAGDLDRLKALWENPALVPAAREEPCSAGFAFWTGRCPAACTETVAKFRRSEWGPPDEPGVAPLLKLTWNHLTDSAGWQLYWDLESPLPPPVEAAVAETVKMVCAQSGSFQRRFRRHLPELAERFDCGAQGAHDETL